MYKLLNTFDGIYVVRPDENSVTTFPINAANTDYQTFKAQINADEAQLEYADGNLMTAEEAKTFIATLP